MLGSGGIAPTFLTSVLDGGELSASRLCRFTSGTHSIGGWMGPRAGLDAVEERKICCPSQESNPDLPARILFLYRLSYPGFPIIIIIIIIIQFFIYLRAELNSQWPITESARIQTARRQHMTKLQQRGQQNKHKK
jgi:hypothetical protein